MSRSEILEALTAVFRGVFDNELIAISPSTTVQGLEAWDSVTQINLIVAVEARFGIRFRTSEMESLQDISHVVDLVKQKTEKR